jgi:hypothetical protein
MLEQTAPYVRGLPIKSAPRPPGDTLYRPVTRTETSVTG